MGHLVCQRSYLVSDLVMITTLSTHSGFLERFFSPYSGTLNLRLTGKEVEKREQLETAGSLTVEPKTG